MDSVKAKAKSNPMRVAFPEANDLKMLQAISISSTEGYCTVYIIGHIDEVKKICEENNIDYSKWKFVDITDETYTEKILKKYLTLPNIIFGEKSLRRRMNDPLYYALVMEAVDEIDVTFGGISSTSGDFILAAQTIIGL